MTFFQGNRIESPELFHRVLEALRHVVDVLVGLVVVLLNGGGGRVEVAQLGPGKMSFDSSNNGAFFKKR